MTKSAIIRKVCKKKGIKCRNLPMRSLKPGDIRSGKGRGPTAFNWDAGIRACSVDMVKNIIGNLNGLQADGVRISRTTYEHAIRMMYGQIHNL